MLRPKDRGVVPPGGLCRYRDPDTGWEFAHPYFDHVRNCARDYRVKQGFPIPHNWEEWFDEQFCKATPQGCVEVPDGKAEKAPGWLQMAANFTRSMANWAVSGFPVVSYEVFKARQTICAGAPAENGQPAVPQCQYFGQFPVFGLTKCTKCGCGGLKLWLATEHCPIHKW